MEDQKWFLVEPRTDCPHVLTSLRTPPREANVPVRDPCGHCGDRSENWRCLTCFGVFCSRYVNSHMLEHYESHRQTVGGQDEGRHNSTSTDTHCVAVSFTDCSCWCYECDSYVIAPVLTHVKEAVHSARITKSMMRL